MKRFRARVFVQIAALGFAIPLAAYQGRGGGGGGSTPPPLPPAPVTVINPVAADCYGGAGCLDHGFGLLGKAEHDVVGAVQNMRAIVIQPDGKIVAAGSGHLTAAFPADQYLIIGRFLANGSPDATFGTGGIVKVDLLPGIGAEFLLGLAVQSDGKVVAAAGAYVNETRLTVALRLTDSGVPDTTFGSGGKVTLSTASSSTSGEVVVQPDGKILIAWVDMSTVGRITRLLATGALDKKFGTQGTRGSEVIPSAMALQSTGAIVVAGRKTTGGDAALTRLTASGAVDSSFGTGGTTTVDYAGQNDNFLSISVGSDDSIAAAGLANGTTTLLTLNMAVARFTANGALVNSFGSYGRVMLDLHSAWNVAQAVNLRSDGRVEFAGWTGLTTTSGHPTNTIVGRLTATGALDSSFGSGGVTETSTGLLSSQATAMAIGPDGGLTVAGQVYNVTTDAPDRWLLSRYFR